MGAHTSSRRDTQAALDAIRRIVQALRASSRRAERAAGMSGAQLFVLQKLADAEPASVNGLAALTHTHQSSVSTVVSRLAAGGYVRRTRAGDDARRAALSLTPKGRRLAARAPDAAQGLLIAGIERLPAARRRLLASALADLATAMDAAGRTPPMFFEEKAR